MSQVFAPQRFQRVYIEITNECANRCPFCAGTRRPPAAITLSGLETLLPQVAQVTKHVYLHVLGDPLCHPKLAEILTLCRQNGLLVNLTTAGGLLSQVSRAIWRSPALRQISVSLHSAATEAELAQRIDSLFEITRNRDTNLPICVFHYMKNANDDSFIAYVVNSLSKKYMVELPLAPRFDRGRTGFTLGNGVYLKFTRRFDWPSPDAPPVSARGFCLGLRRQMAVLCDGTVVPCCLDAEGSISLGNVAAQSLTDILLSPAARSFYEQFSRRQVPSPLCQRCTYRLRFDG